MQKNMEKIMGINPVLEILRSDKNIEKIEVYKGIKKDTIKEILKYFIQTEELKTPRELLL